LCERNVPRLHQYMATVLASGVINVLLLLGVVVSRDGELLEVLKALHPVPQIKLLPPLRDSSVTTGTTPLHGTLFLRFALLAKHSSFGKAWSLVVRIDL
jgi:hypothetical protein